MRSLTRNFSTPESACLATVGKQIHPGRQVNLWHNPREEFDPELGAGQRFRLVLVERVVNNALNTFIERSLQSGIAEEPPSTNPGAA
jgi:hypothetical protein